MEDPRFHILIVEDNDTDAEGLVSILKAIRTRQFRISRVKSIAEARDLLCARNEPVDLIFCDFILNEESGIDLLNMLRALSEAPPTVMITAMDDHEIDVACMRAGARDYLRKGSLTPETLERVIRYTTHNHHTEVALKSALKVREQMLSVVSHDIAGPLATLHATLSFLVARLDSGDREKFRSFLTRAEASAAGILELTIKLLDWAKAQTHHFICNPEPVILADILASEETALLPLLEAKELSLAVDVPHDHVALVDRDSMGAVTRNLMTNAIKFSRKGGTIQVSSNQTGSRVCLKVMDEGVGMSPELRDSLFNEEKKTAQPGTMNEKGHGLGLMLCKALLERNGGIIAVESEPGNGSSFEVSLPTPGPDAAESARRVRKSRALRENN